MPGALTHAGHAAQVKRRNLIGHVAQNDRPKIQLSAMMEHPQ
ncbi:hypothetical protein [Phaeobacter inhibens]|nr:hypothetical protein [Phaeobacter inhibens]